jgi:hypothetical protein
VIRLASSVAMDNRACTPVLDNPSRQLESCIAARRVHCLRCLLCWVAQLPPQPCAAAVLGIPYHSMLASRTGRSNETGHAAAEWRMSMSLPFSRRASASVLAGFTESELSALCEVSVSLTNTCRNANWFRLVSSCRIAHSCKVQVPRSRYTG